MGKKGVMDNDIICAYLWQDVIRLGFSPAGAKNRKKWLLQYGRSLKDFWEIETYPDMPQESNGALKLTIDSSTHIGLSFEYCINTIDKFGITLMYSPPVDDKQLIWIHVMDGQYFSFPSQFFLTKCKQRRQAVDRMSDNDIGRVIDTLIIHPTPHQHIESPLDNHKIRIGGGLLNPFLYLFHLRVQLCPDQKRRDDERIRLIELFKQAVRQDRDIPINSLMMVP